MIQSKFYLASCGCYTVLFFKNLLNGKLDFVLLTDSYPNGIHVAWQLIQIFVMAVAETLFSISGIAFAFSQAPASMKSACQALWYIEVAIGNLIVLIIAESRFISNQVYEYIFFAGIMAIATIIFLILAIFYKYVDNNHENKADNNSELKTNEEKNSVIFNNDDDSVELVF